MFIYTQLYKSIKFMAVSFKRKEEEEDEEEEKEKISKYGDDNDKNWVQV